jgi:hypothetical protein
MKPLRPTLRNRLAVAAGWTVWLVAHLVAGLFWIFCAAPFRTFAFTIRFVVSPTLRGLARFFRYCAAACGVRVQDSRSAPIHFHHN